MDLPGEEGKAWEQAHQIEWQNMVDHSVFGTPAEPPPGTKVLKTGTTLHTYQHNGKINKCKVCIVTKGFSQVPGAHFNKTYAPVMHWESFCTILTLGTITGSKIRQFNIKLAYLHGMMREEVWVQQPEGFEVPGKENLALLLQKALYGTNKEEMSGKRCYAHPRMDLLRL